MKLGTHYYTVNSRQHLAFVLDECESCGGEVQAANAVWVMEPEHKLIRLGLKKYPHSPAEEWYSEEDGMCKCENCD